MHFIFGFDIQMDINDTEYVVLSSMQLDIPEEGETIDYFDFVPEEGYTEIYNKFREKWELK